MATGEDYLGKLYRFSREWDDDSRDDARDCYRYQGAMDEIAFNARLRYTDYPTFSTPNAFFRALCEWLGNVDDKESRKALFRMLSYICFIDRKQMVALYRDVLRRIIAPWVLEGFATPEMLLSGDYDRILVARIRKFPFCSITESARLLDFKQVNCLIGLPKGRILGEDPKKVAVMLPDRGKNISGLIVVEDIVASGNQALRTLTVVAREKNPSWRVLFCPLIILECGLERIVNAPQLQGIDIRPGLVLPDVSCVRQARTPGEPADFESFRTIIKQTAARVLEKYGNTDDPPKSEWGYGDCGAFLVTCHNTPNNTLPLIHHRSRSWSPLFQRVHHGG
ncbi:MAG: hypothetical protein ACM3WU_05450 [Bacillota bacterium]